jgi:hypothetical protein
LARHYRVAIVPARVRKPRDKPAVENAVRLVPANYEAIAAGVHFEDIQARMTFRLLQKMMLKEEMAILGGNAGGAVGGLSLGVPGTPTVSAVEQDRHRRRRQDLCPERRLLEHFGRVGQPGDYLGHQHALLRQSRGADHRGLSERWRDALEHGGRHRRRGGHRGQRLPDAAATVTAVVGAVAYSLVCRHRLERRDPAGDHHDQLGHDQRPTRRRHAIGSDDNSVTISAPLVAGTQSAATITADSSANPSYAYNGLYTTAMAAGSNAYVSTLATGTAGTGTFLTASGRGSVNEIDTMFQTMWNNFQLSPTVLYVNAQELKNITTKVLSNTAGPLLRYERADSAEAPSRAHRVRCCGGGPPRLHATVTPQVPERVVPLER